MPEKKSAETWFTAFGAAHRYRSHDVIHWIAAPVSFASLLGFVWAIPVPEAWRESLPWFNWMLVALLLATAFYASLSPALGAGMTFIMSICYSAFVLIELFVPWPVWQVSLAAFAAAQLALLIGDIINARKFSFLAKLIFLFIGPAWLVGRLYQKIGQRY